MNFFKKKNFKAEEVHEFLKKIEKEEKDLTEDYFQKIKHNDMY